MFLPSTFTSIVPNPQILYLTSQTVSMKINKLFILFLLFPFCSTFSQHNEIALPTSINDTGDAPASGTILDLNPTNKAFRLPLLTTQQRDALPQTEGLVIYNTDKQKAQIQVFDTGAGEIELFNERVGFISYLIRIGTQPNGFWKRTNYARSFKCTRTGELDRLVVPLDGNGNTFNFTLYDGDQPSSPVIETITIIAPGNDMAFHDLVFTSPIILQEGNYYTLSADLSSCASNSSSWGSPLAFLGGGDFFLLERESGNINVVCNHNTWTEDIRGPGLAVYLKAPGPHYRWVDIE